MKREFLFSVIIPVYDAEDFIEEAILSIVKQTIGFKKNIQLILINNATKDNSEKICLKYKEKYPDNIEYVKLKKNRGPAGGRNAGLPYVRGKYFNFLDADDIWDKKAFKAAYKFFEKNYDEIDIISCRRKHFGRINCYHALDYKFTKHSKIIDVSKEPEFIQLHVTSCFFKSKECINQHFNEKIDIGEDSEYVERLILNKLKYGVLDTNINYLYRKREDGKSALDGKESKKGYFLNDYIKILDSLIKKSKEKYNKIVPLIQYHITYETAWLLRSNCSILNECEVLSLKSQVIKYLQNVDDNIIINDRVMKREHKIFALNLKYSDPNYVNFLSVDKLKDMNLFNPISKKNLLFRIIDIREEKLILACQTNVFLNKDRWKIYFKDQNGNIYYPEKECCDIELESLQESIFNKSGYLWKFDLKKIDFLSLKPVLCIDNIEYFTKFRCACFTKVNNEVKNIFFYKKVNQKEYFVKFTGKKLKVYVNLKKICLQLKYYWELIKNFKFNVIFYRLFAKFVETLNKRKILLISDRVHMADDNGELFYKWLISNNKNVKAYYIIDKKSPDVKRIKKYGKVVYYGSLKYKLLFISSHAIVSSMVDKFIYSLPFGVNNIYMSDKNVNRVCLGHGISEQDMSKNESLFSLGLQLYTVANKRELLAKTTSKYGYTDNQIKITGIPRQDYIYLSSKKEKGKTILFAPTWRKSLAGNYVRGKRTYNYKFKESEYFKFFNNLINDKRILDIMKKKGYSGIFNIHPAIKENVIDFEQNEVIKVQERNESYIEQFSSNRMVVTDYSSIANEYAYANSAVIYAQFDNDTFYKNHTYFKGTFDYEEDGFGPVCYDYESTVKEIIKAINNNCKVQEKYSKRKDKYFTFFDDKSCERIYKEIMKLED